MIEAGERGLQISFFALIQEVFARHRYMNLFSLSHGCFIAQNLKEKKTALVVGLVIGSIGVGILLLAFVLNILRILSEQHPLYLLMNVVGSAFAAWYAWEASNVPFIILEFVWGGVALVRLGLILAKKDSRKMPGVS